MSVMIAINGSAIDRFFHSRRDSFSTIASSLASELIRQNELNSIQNNLRVGRNESLHIGDVYNNIFRTVFNANSDTNVLEKPEKVKYKIFDFLKKFLIGAIILSIALGLTAYIVYYIITLDQLNGDQETPMFVPREQWLRGEMKNLSRPIERIIVGHTADESCDDEDECKSLVRKIYLNHPHLNDIPYNFLISGNGRVFEGRGFQYEGEHTSSSNGSSFNDIAIGIAFIGNFDVEPPPDAQVEAFHNFTEYLIKKGIISEQHKIFSQDQIVKQKTSANALINVLEGFKNFHSGEFALFVN